MIPRCNYFKIKLYAPYNTEMLNVKGWKIRAVLRAHIRHASWTSDFRKQGSSLLLVCVVQGSQPFLWNRISLFIPCWWSPSWPFYLRGPGSRAPLWLKVAHHSVLQAANPAMEGGAQQHTPWGGLHPSETCIIGSFLYHPRLCQPTPRRCPQDSESLAIALVCQLASRFQRREDDGFSSVMC